MYWCEGPRSPGQLHRGRSQAAWIEITDLVSLYFTIISLRGSGAGLHGRMLAAHVHALCGGFSHLALTASFSSFSCIHWQGFLAS